MEWKDWIGRVVFIKLNDGTIYSYSRVLVFEDPYLSITDRDGLPVVVNINSIQRIKEEVKK